MIEEELIKIEASLHKKGGVKSYGKVCERIGRLKGKYHSAHKLFAIEIEKDNEHPKSSNKLRGKRQKPDYPHPQMQQANRKGKTYLRRTTIQICSFRQKKIRSEQKQTARK